MNQQGHSIAICPIRGNTYCYSCSQPLIIQASTQSHPYNPQFKKQKQNNQQKLIKLQYHTIKRPQYIEKKRKYIEKSKHEMIKAPPVVQIKTKKKYIEKSKLQLHPSTKSIITTETVKFHPQKNEIFNNFITELNQNQLKIGVLMATKLSR
jgi:hypothetical protein